MSEIYSTQRFFCNSRKILKLFRQKDLFTQLSTPYLWKQKGNRHNQSWNFITLLRILPSDWSSCTRDTEYSHLIGLTCTRDPSLLFYCEDQRISLLDSGFHARLFIICLAVVSSTLERQYYGSL